MFIYSNHDALNIALTHVVNFGILRVASIVAIKRILGYLNHMALIILHFCVSSDLSPGLHTITVLDGEEKYGSTTLEVKSDIEKLQEIFHSTLQTDTMTLLSRLLGSHTTNKEDIEREMIDILSEKPFNPAFLNLMERLFRLEPTEGKSLQPVTLHRANNVEMTS